MLLKIKLKRFCSIEITINGVKPVSVSLPNLDIAMIYKKSLEWVEKSFDNPQEILIKSTDNQSIQIQSFQKDAFYYMGFGFKNEFDMVYTLEIDIQVNEVTLRFIPGQFSSGGQNAPFTTELFFENDGSVNWQCKEAKPSLEKTMNEIGNSWLDFVKMK
jgi:hypothetical protein